MKGAETWRRFATSYKHVRLAFGSDIRSKLAQGMALVADTAARTLGPGGRNVALEYEAGAPKITKDGVTVAKSIFFRDRELDLGSKLVKRVANNTNVFAGDGTTSSALLSSSLVKAGVNAVETQGAHPVSLRRGMEKAK